MGRREPGAAEVKLSSRWFGLCRAARLRIFVAARADERVGRVPVPMSRRLYVDPERYAGEVVQNPACEHVFSSVLVGGCVGVCGAVAYR